MEAQDRELLCENQGVPGDCDVDRQDGGRLRRYHKFGGGRDCGPINSGEAQSLVKRSRLTRKKIAHFAKRRHPGSSLQAIILPAVRAFGKSAADFRPRNSFSPPNPSRGGFSGAITPPAANSSSPTSLRLNSVRIHLAAQIGLRNFSSETVEWFKTTGIGEGPAPTPGEAPTKWLAVAAVREFYAQVLVISRDDASIPTNSGIFVKPSKTPFRPFV